MWRAAALFLLLWPSAGFALPPDRLSTVVDHKLELERQLGQSLNQSLAIIAGTGRAHAAVAITMSAGVVSEKPPKSANPALSFTMGKVSSEQSVKLPGLPTMGSGMGKLHQPLKIRVEPGAKGQQAAQHVEAFVEKIVVHLFLDPELPPKIVEGAKAAMTQLAGLDAARGDSIIVTRVARTTAAPPAKSPWLQVMQAALVVVPLSLIITAAILAVALGRRSPAGGARSLELAMTQASGQPQLVDGVAPAGDGADGDAGEGAANSRAPDGWELTSLETAAQDHLTEILEQLDDREAAATIALAPFEPPELAPVLSRLSPARQAMIGALLAQRIKLPRAKLEELKAKVESLLEAARNPSEREVGGPERLGQILAGSSRSAVRRILEGLQQIDPELARQTRRRVTQFEDLASLPVENRRKLVTSVDPAVLARALQGSEPAIIQAIDQVLSRRQMRILAEERRSLGKVDEEAVEEAREQIQHSLNSSLVS